MRIKLDNIWEVLSTEPTTLKSLSVCLLLNGISSKEPLAWLGLGSKTHAEALEPKWGLKVS